MKDGTLVHIKEKELGDARATFGSDGCVLIVAGEGDNIFARAMIPTDNIKMIDLENDEETGLNMTIYPSLDL